MVALEASELLLDADIRSYVLISILLVVFLTSILRQNLTIIFQSAPAKDLKSVYDGQIVMRLRRLMANGSRIPKSAFERRRAFFNHKDDGLLVIKSLPPKDKQDLGIPGMPSIDPSKMMQGQMSMMMSQLYMVFSYNIIDNVFSGFVAAKLPFSLTGGFKRMLHYGIDVGDLDVSYVSSSSWYIVIFSGLAQITQIILGPGANVSMGVSAEAMVPTVNGQGAFGNTESHDMFKKEKDMVDQLVHVNVTENSVARLPHRYEGHGGHGHAHSHKSHHGHAH